ncbi:23S rRNA (pseudouridine(1915)-N(3))-methyltransferase RlmH [Geochorda subterranea]|uniref:Ribosomal RNA large subunit methyltransferase H n=1 Tax=Geochorda subterranea TaxID=3109564 RepID=A0ABZ1BR81_9FIRM|nr:23S rRNA (pseudouridine(1915)-N(3))-methyltransferase RlmH [Limnochorda sp. LNt]WRP15096.1 23S rRNA (pseudouridine(1915)-N(3))-methyltransferase RlmH [Limnochorda sp. LNt]
MAHIWIVAVGRMRQRNLAQVMETYLDRTARLGLPVRVVEVREGGPARGDVDPATVVKEEGRRLQGVSLPSRLWRVALDERGWLPEGSQVFAHWLEQRLATADVAFFVGGAWGLDAELVARCDERLSLSPLTMAHELARLVLAEQLYRAATLWRGVRYRK